MCKNVQTFSFKDKLRVGSCLFTCEIEVDNFELFVRILLKRLKVDNDLIFLLDSKGKEITNLHELR